MIPCNQINSVAATILDKLEKCTPLNQKDYKTIIDLILSIRECVNSDDPSFIEQNNINIKNEFSLEDIGAESFNDVPEKLTQYINTLNIYVEDTEIYYFKVYENSLKYQIYIIVGKGKGFININEQDLFKIDDTTIGDTEVFSSDILVSLPNNYTFGKYKNGDTIPSEGKTALEVILDALITVLYPTINSPVLTGSTSNVEVGTTTKTFTLNYNRGSILGGLNSGVWNPNLIQGYNLGPSESFVIDGNTLTSTPYTITKTTVLGTNSVTLKVNHDEGDQGFDSLNNLYHSATPEGSFTGNNISWQGFYYRYFIPKNTNVPPSNTEIREIANASSDNRKRNSGGEISIPVGSSNGYTHFHIYVPSTQTLVNVIDVNNSMNDITSTFIQQTNVSLPDASGNNVTYKHYLKVVDNPTMANTVYRATVT